MCRNPRSQSATITACEARLIKQCCLYSERRFGVPYNIHSEAESMKTHKFENGILIRQDDLGAGRIHRYTKPEARNLHEPVEEDWFINALSSQKIATVIDVGAAVGYYSILAKTTFPHLNVHAFDLREEHRQATLENMKLNNLKEGEITIHKEAIGPKSGEYKFMDHSYGSALLPTDDKSHEHYFKDYFERFHDLGSLEENANVKNVTTVSIPEMIANNKLGNVLVKMDVQGAEALLLSSCEEIISQGAVAYWIIGTHSREIHEKVHSLFVGETEVIFSETAVEQQPDGLIVAASGSFKSVKP